jgi:hypothetical protein
MHLALSMVGALKIRVRWLLHKCFNGCPPIAFTRNGGKLGLEKNGSNLRGEKINCASRTAQAMAPLQACCSCSSHAGIKFQQSPPVNSSVVNAALGGVIDIDLLHLL